MFRDRPPARPRQRILSSTDSRAPARRKVHGFTANERDALVAAQGGACAICGRTDQPLQVDHDHAVSPSRYGTRAAYRGMVCQRCNSALGLLGDENVEALARYMARFRR